MAQNTRQGLPVKENLDEPDFSRLDYLTEVVVFMPVGTGTDVFTHRVSTTFLERMTGRPVSEFIAIQVSIGRLRPIGNPDNGMLSIGGADWHSKPEFLQAVEAMGQFDFMTSKIATHDYGRAAQ